MKHIFLTKRSIGKNVQGSLGYPIHYSKIKSKNQLFKTFIKTKNTKTFERYKQLRNQLNSEIRKAKNEYFNDNFLEANVNADVVWKRLKGLISTTQKHNINELLINDNLVNGADLANSFNEYFVNLVLPEGEGHAFNTDRSVVKLPVRSLWFSFLQQNRKYYQQ